MSIISSRRRHKVDSMVAFGGTIPLSLGFSCYTTWSFLSLLPLLSEFYSREQTVHRCSCILNSGRELSRDEHLRIWKILLGLHSAQSGTVYTINTS
ncbi:uncharacterized protein LY89DRAFT_352782 [Mollisia scopiformis]|uniref:Uncharacterized protein n=1 Tax=Mollisia scopiformis TaxID=149040 RepID=A0A132B6B1_MOLSC|nr:uncharacterized protein LY89DRAFT_352782 [Mollisia scopiformis]KUJ07793.1 hypothetical protein LY89DRAFT_352782 [Mollisia scopiformis]